MDRKQANDDRFVNEKLQVLAPPDDWQPNPARGFAGVQERDRRHRRARQRWIWMTAAASVISLGILTAPASCEAASAPTCRRPLALQVWSALFEERAGTPAEASVRQMLENFREAGSVDAPITCEIYSDYQCPGCAAFFLETMPRLTEEYVQTGKIRIVHRDFPLPQHRYAHLAARYANAAGSLGQYDAVVKQLFATQHLWEATGEIDTQVARVLQPDLLAKVRDLVKGDQEVLVNADIAKAREDQIRQTPSLMVVVRGKRQLIAPVPGYPLLKMYLDSLLGK